MTLNGVMAVTLRYFTEFGKPTFQHITAASIRGGIYARVLILWYVHDVVVRKVHVRYVISWRVSNVLAMLSPVRLSSVCNVRALHPTQAIEIFGNVSTPFGMAICW